MSRRYTYMDSHGANLGPLDVDGPGDLVASLGVHNKAEALVRRHRANWPPRLIAALARERDEDRSEALDLDEVEAALRALTGREAFFGPDDELEDAAVRGRRESDRVVSVVFRRPSRRVAVGVIPYAGLLRSAAGYDQLRARRRAEEDRRLGLIGGIPPAA
jgi:hypothetical protein